MLAVRLVSDFFPLSETDQHFSLSFKKGQALPLTLVDIADNAAVVRKGQQFHRI